MDRISSGNSQLDMILSGGFPENSINVVMGAPGTGKTVLVESVIFANATPERKALYLSTVSEPLDKMIRYVQEFEFFDPALIGEAVIFEDLNETLRTKGLHDAVERVIDLIKEWRPAFLVIDSFKAFGAFADSPQHYRAWLAELSAALTSLAITTFLIGEYCAEDVSSLPEFAVADSIIEIVLKKVGVRDIRYLRVLKERGSDFFGGEHALKITSKGVEVFPRLATPVESLPYDLAHQRMSTGVEALDAMVSEGWWRGSSTVVFGPPGSGKTLLGLHFIFKGIEMGERGMIATMEENPTQLARIVAGFGWDLDAAIASGMLELYYVSPVELYIDEFVNDVISCAKERAVQRLLVDSLNDLESASPDPDRFRDYMYAFGQSMSVSGITLMMTSEVRDLFATTVLSTFGISHMSDNVVLLYYLRSESAIDRAISVIKTRASRHEQRIRSLTISSDGIRLGEPFKSGRTGG